MCLVTVSYSCPPPPPPSYVAHSSTHRNGGIELDYVEFLLSQYQTFATPTELNSSRDAGYFNCATVSVSINVFQSGFVVIFVLKSFNSPLVSVCY